LTYIRDSGRYKMNIEPSKTILKKEKIRRSLTDIATSGTPKLRKLAGWMLDNLSLVAFNSIRGIASRAGVDPNIVIRLTSQMGYDGYDSLRKDVQQTLQNVNADYEDRVRALHERKGHDIYSEAAAANLANAAVALSPENIALLDSCIDPLLAARRVYSIGVRSCYSLAHYFSYVGSKAFDNIITVPTMPGSIVDQVSDSGPEDIVFAISYKHYSSEVVRACQIARDCGARVLAMTDSYASPIALDAWKVVLMPMTGPQIVPPLSAAFSTIEIVLAAMAARHEGSADKIAHFEDRIRAFGGYSSPVEGQK